LENHLEILRDSGSRAIVGIETGSIEGRIGAVLVEVTGSGAETVLDLVSFRSMPLPADLQAALKALACDAGLEAEELAEINFLILHNINSIFHELIEESDVDPDEIDLIGLKRIEVCGREFPDDPGALCELTGCIVASCFSIGPEEGGGNRLPVKEAILKGMVDEMVEKYDIDLETREAVAVSLLANEAVYHDTSEGQCLSGEQAAASRRIRKGAVTGEVALHGEFFFPAF
jgi:hypothetical protein